MVPNSVSYYRSASYSHVGMVRKVNEDASLDAPEAGLWVVADGMGGHAAGDFVSSLIVDTLRRIPAASSLPAYVGALRTGLAQVNERVRQEAGLRGVSVMGSTLVLLAARGNQASCLWAGDSRLYRLRGGVLEAISRDHSYVQELLDNALISEEEARHHPRATWSPARSACTSNWNCRKPRCTCCPATASCSAATASTRPPTTANCATCSPQRSLCGGPQPGPPGPDPRRPGQHHGPGGQGLLRRTWT